jgi:hypothetical protein
VNLQLIEHVSHERRLCRIGTMDQHVVVTGCGFACSIALAILSVTYVTNGYFATDAPGGR